MKELKKLIKSDLYRYYGGKKIDFIKKSQLFGYRYTKVLRYAHYCKTRNKLLYLFYSFRLNNLQTKYGYQISSSATIGKGLYIGHFGPLIVNPAAVLGDNVNLAANVVIGQQNRGKKKGAPTIGSRVWIGTGAVVVGKITIGDDVMIAPNAYVNFDVPSNSIVVGNPGVIHSRENATEGYIQNMVLD
ncbi:MAG: serine acetyltransferase [Ruminococcaceae bacterium]|nr:serine acetyltransferase [Oscillospiraceae bacterium]